MNSTSEKKWPIEIAGLSLERLIEKYRTDLFNDYLPFWNQHGIDHELGGFMCAMDHDGTKIDTHKRIMFQGRGLWLHSFLYNQFGDIKSLEIAEKARDFLIRHGRDKNGDWVRGVDRQGNTVKPADGLGLTGIFVAEGLQEYYKATHDEASMDLALDSLNRYFDIYDDNKRHIPQWYLAWCYPGMRTLGYEEMTIRVLTQVLEQVSLPSLTTRLKHSVDAVIHRFWNKDHWLNNEVLDHEYKRPLDDSQNFFYVGHSIVTFWMIMAEAMRIGDSSLFDLAAQRFKRHVEMAWDDVYGGLFRGIYLDGKPVPDKRLWVQDEALVGSMMLIQHGDLEWALSWFNRIYQCVEDNFSLRKYGLPNWITEANRQMTFEPHSIRKENYHHPRQLALNLLALEQLAEKRTA